MTSIEELVDGRGVILRREALARGVDDDVLARLVRGRVLRRLRHGAYVISRIWNDAGDAARHCLLAWAVLKLYSDEVVLSHASSVVWQGGPTWGLDLTAVHLTDVTGRGGRSAAKVVHHRGVCGDDDVHVVDGARTTRLARAVVEVLASAGLEAALVQANHFLHVGAMTAKELRAACEAARFWPGTLATETLWRLASAKIESVGETRTYLMLWRGGIPLPVCQHDIRDDAGGFIGRVDFAWPKFRVLLEFDGMQKYGLDVVGESPLDRLAREKTREDRLREAGWTVIRITWADLAHPERTLRRIREVLERAA